MTTPAIWEREMMDVAAREAAPFVSRRSAAMTVLFSGIVLQGHYRTLGVSNTIPNPSNSVQVAL
jgi:hypothetical protein